MATRPFDSAEWMSITEHLLASGVVAAAQQIFAELLTLPTTTFEHRILAATRFVISGGAATTSGSV